MIKWVLIVVLNGSPQPNMVFDTQTQCEDMRATVEKIVYKLVHSGCYAAMLPQPDFSKIIKEKL